MKIDGSVINAPVDPSQWTSVKDIKKAEDFAKSLDNAIKQKDQKRLYESCQQLESVFLNKVFDAMRATVPRSDLLEKSTADDIFESMLYEEYSKQISKTNTLGIAAILYRQLKV